MKKIGMIGGAGWVSSMEYYRLLNEITNKKLGGLNAARLIMFSVNFADIDRIFKTGKLEEAYPIIQEAALALKNAGADLIIICTNTMHVFAPLIKKEFSLPLIHIGEETAKEIKSRNISKVALLGTKFTMEMDFYRSKLKEQGIETLIPNKEDRLYIHDAIINELVKDQFEAGTKKKFLEIMKGLANQGAEGIILGCTEIPLLVNPEDFALPLFNTTEIHAHAAVNVAND